MRLPFDSFLLYEYRESNVQALLAIQTVTEQSFIEHNKVQAALLGVCIAACLMLDRSRIITRRK